MKIKKMHQKEKKYFEVKDTYIKEVQDLIFR